MKITKSELKEIIREEIESLNEFNTTPDSIAFDNEYRELKQKVRFLDDTVNRVNDHQWAHIYKLFNHVEAIGERVNELSTALLKADIKVKKRPLKIDRSVKESR